MWERSAAISLEIADSIAAKAAPTTHAPGQRRTASRIRSATLMRACDCGSAPCARKKSRAWPAPAGGHLISATTSGFAGRSNIRSYKKAPSSSE